MYNVTTPTSIMYISCRSMWQQRLFYDIASRCTRTVLRPFQYITLINILYESIVVVPVPHRAIILPCFHRNRVKSVALGVYRSRGNGDKLTKVFIVPAAHANDDVRPGSSPGKGGHNSPQISSVIDPTIEQRDAALDSFRTLDDSRKKASTTRPPNAFMLFRSDFWAREKLKVEPIERDHRDISRIAAICWNSLDDDTKAVYRKRAKEHRAVHRLQHPEYRYSPTLQETARKGRRRTVKSESMDDERCKRLAGQVMGEFQKGKWPRNNARRMVRDTDFQNSFDDTEELVKPVGMGAEVRLEPTMACGEGPIPAFYSEGKVSDP